MEGNAISNGYLSLIPLTHSYCLFCTSKVSIMKMNLLYNGFLKNPCPVPRIFASIPIHSVVK
jgi:hypothetical protein